MAGMTFLKKALAQDFTKSVKYQLHNHLTGMEPGRPLSTVHASEVTKPEGICPREYALSDLLKKKPRPRWLSTSENITYHLGRVLQDSVVNWFADMGKAVCHWKCMGCGKLYEFQSRPFKCEGCNVRAFTPVEVRFESAVTGISCGVDMLAALGETKLRPVEIKTMAADQFKTLVAPLAEHRLRTNLYLRIIAESAHPWASLVSSERAQVLYISKTGYGCSDDTLKKWGLKESFSPFKEFDVTRDDKATDYLTGPAKIVKAWRDGKIGMAKGVCPSSLAKRAANCNCKPECFSGEFPPEYDWTKT